MNFQADWWLLLLGLGLGAGLTWLVLAEMRRHDDDVAAAERAVEAAWIADMLSAAGTEADSDGIEEVLRLHRLYLASLPFDEPAWTSGTPSWPPTGALQHSADAPDPATTPDPADGPGRGADVHRSAGDATHVKGDGPEGEPAE